MRPLAKTLIAGTCLATASLCAGATSAQSYAAEVWARAQNRQVQSAPVVSDTTLQAVEPESFAVTGAASGNAFGTGADGASLEFGSEQVLDGDVTSTSLTGITGTSYAGSVNTSAVGNAGSAVTYDGNLRGRVSQTVEQGRLVTADAHLDQGPTGALGDVGMATTAVANNQSYGTTYGYVESYTDQRSGATVFAETGADVTMVTGTGAFATTAVGNNLSSAVDMGSGYTEARQSQTGDSVYAGTYVASAWGQQIAGTAAASANNMVVTNAYGPMEVAATQDNTSYVRSQAETAVYEYGSVTTTSAGVGNAIIASSLGADTTFVADQTTQGGVDVYATFTGGHGYDSVTQATAHGNSIAVASCSTCVTSFEADSRQVNNEGVSAQAHANVTGSARSAVVSSGAVGNSASYYVQRPTGY